MTDDLIDQHYDGDPREDDDGIAEWENDYIASDAPETRRTPWMRPLGMNAVESWDFDLYRDF